MDISSLPIEIDCASVQQQRNAGADMVLLDCREEVEVQAVKIDGGTWIPMSEMVARAGELAAHRERNIVVYCHLGGRSLQVANWLREQGFAGAQSMAGGIDQWADQIDPSLPRY